MVRVQATVNFDNLTGLGLGWGLRGRVRAAVALVNRTRIGLGWGGVRVKSQDYT